MPETTKTKTLTTREFLEANKKPFELRTTEKRAPGDGPRTFHVGQDNIDVALEFIADCQRAELDAYYIGDQIKEIPTYDSGQWRPTKREDIELRNSQMIDIDGGDVDANREVFVAVMAYLAQIGIVPWYAYFTGCGFQIVLRLAGLDTSKETETYLQSFQQHFKNKFDTELAKVDLSASTLPRLMRVPGTDRFKGRPRLTGKVEFISDNPTALTLEKIQRYQGDKVAAAAIIPIQILDLIGGPISMTMRLDDFREMVEAKGHATTDHDLGFNIDVCPRSDRKETTSTVLATHFDGQLKLKCQHNECKHDTAGLLKDLGIQRHEISSLYSEGQTTSSKVENWIRIVKPIQRDGNRLITKDGLTIIVGTNATFIQEGDKPKLYAAYDYVKKNREHWLDKIEEPLRKESHELTTTQRLVDRILKQCPGLVEFNGVLMKYANGGYVICEGKGAKGFVSKLLASVTAADVKYLRDSWGCVAKETNVINSSTESVLTLLRGLLRKTTEWDLPLSVNYSNGIWLSDTDKLIEHHPKHFVRPSLKFEYSETATAPKFEKFLSETYHEKEQRDLAWEVLGCIMVGDVAHEKCFSLYGDSRAGKGAYAKVATHLAGGCASPSVDDLSDKNGLTHCIGRSLMIIPEAENFDKKATARLKAITGQDAINIHIKYGASFSGCLGINIVTVSNEQPNFRDPSGAVMQRLILLHHTQGRDKSEIDTTLKQELMGELPGIARLARIAYQRYKKQGFTHNPHVQDTLNGVLEETSPVKKFVQECCSVGKGNQIERNTLHEAYTSFLHELGHAPISARAFTTQLRSACSKVKDGGRPTIKGVRQRVWKNIKLKD